MLHSLILLAFLASLTTLAVIRPMAGVIAFECFTFMSPQQETFGITGTLPVALIAALATVIGCIVNREPKKFPVNSITILITCFLIQATISTIFALAPPSIVLPVYTDLLKSFGFLLLVAALLTNRKRIHALVWLIVLSIGYYGVKGGIFTLLTGGNDHVYGPPNSILTDNNQLAVALLTVLPLMNYLRVISAHRVIRFGMAAAMMLCVIAVAGTYSRGGFLALFAMSAFLWWNSKGRIRSGVLIALGLILAVGVMPSQWVSRMNGIQNYHHSNSANDRLTVWRQAFGIALANPLTGAGFKATATPSVIHRYYPQANQRATHSIWFQILSQGGFPFLFIFIALNVASVIKLHRIRWRTRGDPSLRWIDELCRMIEVSMIAFLVGGSFLSLGYYSLFYTLLLMIAALGAILQTVPAPSTIQADRRIKFPDAPRPLAPSWRLRRSIQK
ncbi:MAG: putative O-glycosylation ligase, exosortase A system-associated [Acidiphilium sp.]|nr:putative O-glycosylation ligase, exosortase A system-associated [Acidiphilium sp.]MDD4935311.1 putative O-glycosylation ligase, exosortase A system-associated [Acidiphilium sp.]